MSLPRRLAFASHLKRRISVTSARIAPTSSANPPVLKPAILHHPFSCLARNIAPLETAPIRTPLKQSQRHNSTIYALSSAHGKAGVAIIRVSGRKASHALLGLTGSKKLPEPRKACLKTLKHPRSNEVLDQGLVLWFPGPASFTGEDCVEFHVHGGVAVVASVLSALSKVSGLRPADPGEFTKRAFAADKLDLTQVEGLADLLAAETEIQRKQAVRELQGDLKKIFERWRGDLLKQTASLEAYIDFAESEEIEDGVLASVTEGVAELAAEIDAHLLDVRAGERLRTGVHIAILGEPNVGKSSFLNLLARRPAAIVSPTAGTTRDLVEATLDLGGFPAVVVDTAGLRTGDEVEEVEREGIERAKERGKTADLVVFLVDASKMSADKRTSTISSFFSRSASAEKTNIDWSGLVKDKLKEFGLIGKEFAQQKKVILVNKMDLLENCSPPGDEDSTDLVRFISCKTEEGLRDALEVIESEVKALCTSRAPRESPLITKGRQKVHLERASEHLHVFRDDSSEDLAIASEQLRLAIREIGHLTGKVSTEQILDVIFAEFCIGK